MVHINRLRIGFLVILLLLCLSHFSRRALGAGEEIQVYMDDMDKPGQFGLDVHLNYAISARKQPDYSGEQPPDHVFRLTPEPSFGLTDYLELGGYLITSVNPSGTFHVDGEKLRLKFIAPKSSEDQSYFWGANFEIGFAEHRFDENPWNAELKGIFGFRKGPWTVAVNPNLDWTVSGPHPAPLSLEIDTKIAYELKKDLLVGIESYNELGEFRRFGRLNEQSEMLYGVIDTTLWRFDINFGVGYGLTSPSDRWVIKMIVGVPIGG
jgi:hypothetical protein